MTVIFVEQAISTVRSRNTLTRGFSWFISWWLKTVRWMCRMRNHKLHCLPNCHHNSCESDYLGCEQTRMTEQTIRSSGCSPDYLLREILWEENLFFLLFGLCSYSLVPFAGCFFFIIIILTIFSIVFILWHCFLLPISSFRLLVCLHWQLVSVGSKSFIWIALNKVKLYWQVECVSHHTGFCATSLCQL